MSATVELRVFTGVNASVESSGDLTSLSLMASDAVESDGEQYHASRVLIPGSSSSYSYERWLKLRFSGSFTSISNVKAYLSSGSLVDSGLDLLAGTTDTGATPANSASSIAVTSRGDWDSVGEAIDITPSGGISSSPGYSNFLVLQLSASSSVVEVGDIGFQGLSFSFDET